MEGHLIQVRDVLAALPSDAEVHHRVSAVARLCVRDYGGSILHVGPRKQGVTEALATAARRGRRQVVHVAGWDVHGDDAPAILLRIRKGRYAFALFDSVDPLQQWLEAAMSGTDGIICATSAEEPSVGAAVAGALAECRWWDPPLRMPGTNEAWLGRGWGR